MTRPGDCLRVLACALALLCAALVSVGTTVAAERESTDEAIFFLDPSVTLAQILRAEPVAEPVTEPIGGIAAENSPTTEPWIETLPEDAAPLGTPAGPDAYTNPDGTLLGPDDYFEYAPNDFTWQVGPSGIIYRSYLAGPHEPRISITPMFSSSHAIWDATVGGRGGVVRYGDRDPLHPQGWQLDVYGASIVRMDAEHHQDLNSADFVFGFPITYGVDNWQFKLGYAHLSSHLGDEYSIRYPDVDRINYVRDGLVFGTSWFPREWCRVYAEYDWAFHTSGGANPVHFQFGNELSYGGPTGLHGSPFLAVNARLRQENDYGGDLTIQTGWLWRGDTGKTFRLGFHYFNGKSSQSQFFNTFEDQIGLGLWYDF